ncbi:MAG: hypothetical protein AAF514_14005 [Verrucomicrobiota bacterium]
MKLNAPGQPSPSLAGAILPIEAPSTSNPLKPAPSTPAPELHLVHTPNDSNRTDPSINAEDGNLNGHPTPPVRSTQVGIRYPLAGSDRQRLTHCRHSILPAEGKPRTFPLSTPSRV